MFFSTHYAGEKLALKFRNGEPWKKVFGPVFMYVNSVSTADDPLNLWADAKEQMFIETESWPYDFPQSQDFYPAQQRGLVSGRLLVRDRYLYKSIVKLHIYMKLLTLQLSGLNFSLLYFSYISERLITANSASVGLAPPGDPGSWQVESKVNITSILQGFF